MQYIFKILHTYILNYWRHTHNIEYKYKSIAYIYWIIEHILKHSTQISKYYIYIYEIIEHTCKTFNTNIQSIRYKCKIIENIPKI